MRTLAPLCLLALSATIAGCASRPAIEYHTLMPPPDAAAPAATPATGLRFRIDNPVRVPSQVDQPQVVLRQPDGRLQVLELQRWVAALSEEWRSALADRLARQLGAIDVSRVSAANDAPVFRLQLELQRFDGTPNGAAVQQALWSVRRPNDPGPALTCQVMLSEPAGADVAAVAAAQRRVTARVADGIGAALLALHEGRPAACP